MKEETERTSSETVALQGSRKVKAGLAASLFLVPPLIPLYFALGLEAGTLRSALFGFAGGLLVVNAMLLYVMYRWLQTTMQSPSSPPPSSERPSSHGSQEKG